MKYAEKLKEMHFSYSSVTTFQQCKYAFFLTYVAKKERGNNAFGEYGTFMHSILEKFFKEELLAFELPEYYARNYYSAVTKSFPKFMKFADDEYFDKGLRFFTQFDFDISDYDVLVIEEPVKTEDNGINLVVKPDLVLKEKKTGKMILVDFKTANAYKNGKLDSKKVKDYLVQFYLYCYYLSKVKGIEIDEIDIWFITNGTIEKIPFDRAEADKVSRWFTESVSAILNEEKWKPNNESSFFCNELCSVSKWCKYK